LFFTGLKILNAKQDNQPPPVHNHCLIAKIKGNLLFHDRKSQDNPKIQFMENKKIIWGGLAGGLAFFLLGWLLYGVLMKNFFDGQAMSGIYKEIPDFPFLIIGNVIMGFLYAVVICNWAKANSVMDGAKKGIFFALLLGFGYDFIMYSTSNIMTLPGMLGDIVVNCIMGLVVGAIVAAVAGVKQPVKA
jgi:hypothetical protein